MADVFISYARASAETARLAAAALRGQGFSVWFDEDLPAHRAYAKVIEEELDRAKAALVLWSPEATRSEWVMSEANRAREARKLVQVAVAASTLPMPFDQIQCADLKDWRGEADARGWRAAVASIADLVARPEDAAPGAARGRQAKSQRRERRHLTFLACNLAGATALARSLDPEVWLEVASAFEAAATHEVSRFGGHLARSGEGLVACFGYPEAMEDAAERAVRAGLAIREAAGQLTTRFEREVKVPLAACLGVHSGVVVVAPGRGGDPEMFGEAPRRAAAVERAAAPGELIVTHVVRELVAHVFPTEPAGQAPADGAEPLALYRVLGSGAAALWRASEGAGAPLVGRESEMELLAERWARTVAGDGQFVLVSGEPGIGKSRLVEALRDELHGTPHRWLACTASPVFANTPFHALSQLLADAFRWPGELSPQQRYAALAQALAAAGLAPDDTAPLVADLLGLPVPADGPAAALPPEQRRRRLIDALVAWVFAVAADQPLALLVEDLQWIDPSSVEVVQIVADQGDSAAILMLGTARPEWRPPWHVRAHHTHLVLDRLDEPAVRALLQGVLRRTGLPPGVVEALIRRSDGVPLFAEELARLMADEGSDAAGREIPATLLDSLAARLDRTGRAKETAQVAAVVGREFSYPLLEALAGLAEPDLREDLTRLIDAQLIQARGVPPAATYQFRHGLIRDAAYDALLRPRRRELHGQVGQTLADRFPETAHAQPEVVAQHWSEAGEAERALPLWKTAAEAAYERRAFKESEAAWRRALAALSEVRESPERDARELELCSGLNRVLQLTHGYSAPETLQVASRARELAERSGSLSQLIREEAKLWRAVFTSGDLAASTRIADRVLELTQADGGNPSRLLFAHNAQLQTRFYTGDIRGVEEHYLALNPLIESVGDRQAPGNNVLAIGIASLCAWASGRHVVSEERMAWVKAMAAASGDPYDQVMAFHVEAGLRYWEGRPKELRAIGYAMRLVCQENGFSFMGGQALLPLGSALALLGEPAQAVVVLRQAVADHDAAGADISIRWSLTRLAEAQLLAGQRQDAAASLEAAFAMPCPEERIFRPETHRIRGELRRACGEAALADADFREMIAISADMGAAMWVLRGTAALARLLGEQGRAEEGARLLAPLCVDFGEAAGSADAVAATAILSRLKAVLPA